MNSVFQDSPKEIKNGKQVLPIEEYYAKEKWRTAMQPLQVVDEGPPDKEKKELSYWGWKHYSQEEVVELFKNDYKLPDAFLLP